jgi:oligogalacturonide lyase
MAKHTVRALDFVTRTDPDTGARVTRLTPTDVTCHRNYFYQKAFTEDGRKLVFGGEFGPAPHWNYHLLDLDSRTALQLSEGAGENTFGGFLSPDDRHLYFVRGGRTLVRLALDGLHEETVYTVPEGWVGYGTWVANSACTKMVGIEIAAQDWSPLSDWKQFAGMFHRRPRCRLFRIDLATGERTVILEQQGWLGHPQYRPGDDHTVAYCHEGPHDLVDARMWFIDEDGRNRRCGKVHAPGESCTHEFWVPDGSAMVFVSYFKGQRERWISSLDPVTLESRRLMTMPPCSHLMSNHDGSLMVGDGCGSPADVADADAHQIADDPYLHLFDLRAGRSQRIARHDSSWKVHKGNRQVTHPHPSFTPDGRQVLYSCDAEGEPALYLADLPTAS